MMGDWDRSFLLECPESYLLHSKLWRHLCLPKNRGNPLQHRDLELLSLV